MLRFCPLGYIISESSFQKRGDRVDQTEFQQALETYWDTVYRVALGALGSAADAEDAVQEVMLKFYTQAQVKGKAFESEAHVKHWLICVTINACRGSLRSFWRKNRVSLDDLAESQVFYNPEQGDLFQAVMSLSEQHRLALYLYYYEDYSAKEIASLLGLTEAHARTRLSRARSKLKEVWQDE